MPPPDGTGVELTGSSDEERAADKALERIIHTASQLMREGMRTGALRAANIPHTLQSVIGMLIYHFASGDFGTELLGRSVFEPEEVKRRKDEIKALLHHGLVVGNRADEGE